MDQQSLRGKQVGGKYEVHEVLTEGTHTLTCTAAHVERGEPYALEILKVPRHLGAGEREGLLQDLIQTAGLVRRASADNHVIAAPEEIGPLTLDGGVWVPFIAYAAMGGVSLARTIRDEREWGLPPRSLEEAIELLEPVALALASAHEHGVVHAGLTPDNILVAGDARSPLVDLRVVNFGVARLAGDMLLQPTRSSDPAHLTVTAPHHDDHFAAPEQVDFTGHQVGPTTDVYSLALVLAHLLTPVDAEERLGDQPSFYRATPGQRGVFLDPAVEDAFAAALKRDPAERPRDVMSFWNLLRGSRRMEALSLTGDQRSTKTQGMGGTDPTPAAPEAEVRSTGPTVRRVTQPPAATAPRGKRLAYAAAAAAMVIAGGGAYAISRAGPLQEEAASATTEAPTTTVAAPASAVPAAASCPAGMAKVEAGQFFMGSDEPDALDFEKPAHAVQLDGYCIDVHEVTVAEYKACSDVGKCKRASKVNVWLDIDDAQREVFDPLCNMNDPEGRGEHPVNCVTWRMAKHYCEEQDKRLPTEAEWELATRGRDGRIYPWGDEQPSAEYLNACGAECLDWAQKHEQRLSAMYDGSDGYAHTAPVGSFPKGRSPFGLHDVVGNVWEWVGDWYMPYTNEKQTNPTGPEVAKKRVIRGGAWNGGHTSWVRPTFRYRDYPDTKSYGIGFRCAKSL